MLSRLSAGATQTTHSKHVIWSVVGGTRWLTRALCAGSAGGAAGDRTGSSSNVSGHTAHTILDQCAIDVTSQEFARNHDFMRDKMREVSEVVGRVEAGGGEKAVHRHTQVNNKLLVADRLKLLLDDDGDACGVGVSGTDAFLELGVLAGVDMEYGCVPRAGLLTGIGRVSGRHCMILANDATVKGGTVYPVTVSKQLRAQELAHRLHLPCLYLVDSGGAFLPLQADIFNRGGRVFYNEAVMSADSIPQLSVVCGSCTAGGAYVPTMSDQAIICDKIGTIFLGGPPLVYAATGEKVTPDQLGGAMLHSSVSGCTDYYAVTEPEAYEVCRNQISNLMRAPVRPDGSEPFEDPLYDPSELDYLCGESKDVDMYHVISRIADASRLSEFKARFGTGIITGFSRIHGVLVGIVANHNGAPIGPAEAMKAAHFVQLANQQFVPLLFLVNTGATAVAADSNGEAIKGHAQLMSCISSASVDKVTVVVGAAHGMSQHAMCGRGLEPTFHWCWPSATLSEGEEGEGVSDALSCANHLHTDGIILPHNTRTALGQCLQVIQRQHEERVNKVVLDAERRGGGRVAVIRM